MEENRNQGMTKVDPGTFSFLQAGWWVLHVIAIAGIFYLGYLYGHRVF